MLDTIEIFRPGTHVAESGKSFTFSEADVAGIAASYDPAVFAAPIVLGHPKTEDPAWGWIKGLSVNDAGVLVAATEKVAPAFAEGVEAGHYRKVSAAFYAPEDQANPTPGKWCLRHVGFLGAKAPAVKGLQAAFAEDKGEPVCFADAADWQASYALSYAAQAFRALRDWMIGKFGQDEADKVLPAWTDQSIASAATAIQTAPDPDAPVMLAYAENVVALISSLESTSAAAPAVAGLSEDPAIDARAAELDQREQRLNARDRAFAETERQGARAEDLEFIDGLVAAGKLPPGFRADVIAAFAQADGDTTITFAEPDATVRTALKKLLGALGTTIQFAEFSAGDGFDGKADPAVLASRATQMVEEARGRGETLSYADAVTRAGRA